MTTLTEKLNMNIGEELLNVDDKGVVFCARNMVKVFNCKTEYIEDALNDACYYAEDGDYTQDDLILLAEIVDEFGSQQMNYKQVIEKHIWFDKK